MTDLLDAGKFLYRVSMLFALIVFLSCCTGCGNGDGGETGKGTVSAEEPGKPIQISKDGPGHVKLIIIGLDGADWHVFDKLMKKGEAPAMASLVDAGSWGRLRSEHPLQSPPIWNTIATGTSRKKHGITSFMLEADNGEMVPVTTRMRKRKAFWNIFSDYGISTGVIAWWPTWPAERIRGYVVSQRAWPVRFSLHGVPFGAQRDRNRKPVIPDFSYRTWPESLFDEFRPLILTEDTVTLEEIMKFIHWEGDAASLRGKLASDPNIGRILFNLVWVYARDTTFFRAGMKFLTEYPTDVFAIYFEGTDVVGHYFWQFRPEEKFNLPGEQLDLFGPVVDNYYKYMDRVVGDLVRAAGENVNVVIVSDHGFETKWDMKPLWEKGEKINVEGGMGVPWYHADNGIIVTSGPAFRKGMEIENATIYDITPTILPVMNVPVGRDMEGRPLMSVYNPGKVKVEWLDTHETPGNSSAEHPEISGSPVDGKFKEKLKSLGYIQ